MPVSIQKIKPKAVKVEKPEIVDPSTLGVEELADAYGNLEDAVNALMTNPIFTRWTEVQKELTKRLTNYEPADKVEIKGAHYLLEIGVAARNPAELSDKEKLRTIMGEEVFLKCATENLSDVKAYLTPEQLKEVLNEDTGYSTRRKIVAKFLG